MSGISQAPVTAANTSEKGPRFGIWRHKNIPLAIRRNKTLDKVFERLGGIETQTTTEVCELLSTVFAKGLRGTVDPSTLSDPDCAICHERMERHTGRETQHFAMRTLCGHAFGYGCLVHWWTKIGQALTCPMCRALLARPLDEYQLFGPPYTKAFEELRRDSNNWTVPEIEQRATNECMDAHDWIQELTEIYAGLLWPMFTRGQTYRKKAVGPTMTEKDAYRQKAKALIRKLEEKMSLDRAPPEETASIGEELRIKHENADRHEALVDSVPGTLHYRKLVDIPILQELSRRVYEYQYNHRRQFCPPKSRSVSEPEQSTL